MQEKKDFGGICVAFRQRQEIKIVMADIEILLEVRRSPFRSAADSIR